VEQDYQHYKDRTTEVLSDSMRKACLQSMCPNDLSNHIDLNIVRLHTYDDLKKQIKRYVEQVFARNGPVPMDIGTFSKGDSKGEGKGKDKGKCKRKSYQASWSSTSGPTGSGKATGREQFHGDCGRCGKWGRKKVDCYAKRNVNRNVLMEKPAQPGKGKGGRFTGNGKGKGKQKGGVHEFAVIPEGEDYPLGGQGQEGKIGTLFTLTEDDPALTSSQGKSDKEKKTGTTAPTRESRRLSDHSRSKEDFDERVDGGKSN
jgi:hypothetical protein